MYKTIMLDGEEITVKLDVDEKEKERIILPDLEETDNLTDIINYINNNPMEEETNE